MLMDFIRNHYGNQLGNSGKQQVGMKCFLILCFSPGNTKTVLKVVNGFFYIHTDFIGGNPLLCTTDSSKISTEVLLWIEVDHSSTGRRSTWMVTMADMFCFLCDAVLFPLHFGTDELHGWETAV